MVSKKQCLRQGSRVETEHSLNILYFNLPTLDMWDMEGYIIAQGTYVREAHFLVWAVAKAVLTLESAYRQAGSWSGPEEE